MFRQMLLCPDPEIKSSCQPRASLKVARREQAGHLACRLRGRGALLSIDHVNRSSVLLKLNVFLSAVGCGGSSLSACVCVRRRAGSLCSEPGVRVPAICCFVLRGNAQLAVGWTAEPGNCREQWSQRWATGVVRGRKGVGM